MYQSIIIYLSIYVFMYLSIHLSTHSFMHLSIYLSLISYIYVRVYLSPLSFYPSIFVSASSDVTEVMVVMQSYQAWTICLSPYLSIYLSIYPSIYLYIYLSIHLSTYLKPCMSIAISIRKSSHPNLNFCREEWRERERELFISLSWDEGEERGGRVFIGVVRDCSMYNYCTHSLIVYRIRSAFLLLVMNSLNSWT